MGSVVRAMALAGLFMASALAGCLAQDDAPAPDFVVDVAPPTFESFAVGGGFEFPYVVPEGTGGLLVDYRYVVTRAASPGAAPASMTILAHGPGGAEYAISSAVLEGAATRAQRSSWTFLPPTAGPWTFEGLFEGQSAQGWFNVTVAPALPDLVAVAPRGEDRGVVVAVVDTGINPYHDVFQRPGLTTDALPRRLVDAASGEGPVSVDLRRADSWIGSLRGDAARWSALPNRTLVHFAGTNVLGYHTDGADLPEVPLLDRQRHGTWVAHSAVRENPDVLMVMVTGDADGGVEWASRQPWIDIVSMSWGPFVNAAGPVVAATTDLRTPAVTREAWRAGQLVLGASGNDPTPTFTDTTSGPPWVHAVSGSVPGGRAFDSGNFVDTVANWTQTLASSTSLNATQTVSGTSFATPTTAGIAARILHEVREATGHRGGLVNGTLVATDALTLRHADLRGVLNRSAAWWTPASFTDAEGALGETLPILPAPWVSQGWGHLDGTAVPGAVADLLGQAALPSKPAEARLWLASQMSLRESYWEQRVNVFA